MNYDFSDYAEMRQRVGELFQERDLTEATRVLEWGLTHFPDHLLANAYNLATCHAFLEQPEAAVRALEYGLDHGCWYGTWDFEADVWAHIKDMDAFQAVRERSEAQLQRAQEQAKPELTVVTPKDYDPSKSYPFFLALHGGGETVADFRPQWISPRLESEFIIAYPQSSRVVSMTGFSWMGNDRDRSEIADAWHAIQADYNIDLEKVIIGGFSAGGHMALTLMLDEEQILPTRGFIALCPPVPEDYPPGAIARMRDRGQRGVLLTTEMDNRLAAQKELAEALEAGGLPLVFEVTPNIGHWYPTDIGEKIDRGIDYILGVLG